MKWIRIGAFWAVCCISSAASAGTSGQFNVECPLSHTLADDAIVYPGQPGIAMWHDFFGNKSANAFTTGKSLLAQPATTCDNYADASSYWAPSLRLADGRVIRPMYQKTYYRAIGVDKYPVSPLPDGLQLLAGNHHGFEPSAPITFICSGQNYSKTIPAGCTPNEQGFVQFNVAVLFPDCWDGQHLSPIFGKQPLQVQRERAMSGRQGNAVYSDSTGKCAANYVHIPQLNLNLAYNLGTTTNLDGAQLSMDPTVVDGKVVQENWGSLYTAHADFVNGWQNHAAQYMVTYCLNKGWACDKRIPFDYSEALADTTLSNLRPNENTGSAHQIHAKARYRGDADQEIALLRFAVPDKPDVRALPNPKYAVQLYGANASTNSARIIALFETDDNWDEASATWSNTPLCPDSGRVSTMYLNNVPAYRTFDVTDFVKDAQAQGKKTISFCVRGTDAKEDISSVFAFDSREGANPPLLILPSNP
ncbi:DUF1996 domain-containing protein [Trinickia terrae]|uniref:DUF1996 domain-containing protein n=1 Tax=Trinickia terrae TaxID=2571161 RepID=A0A4U1HMW7_9BURK|nr:DUF1996 domain-containing protein [Trinickia terrae]TKC82655.1 DUF1996 domain-containing protein [Trinickia terrae]